MSLPIDSAAPRELPLPDAAAASALGVRLAALLEVGDALLLSGPLGAGKTTLARGLIAAWTGETDAPSPSYALLQWYEGPRGPLAHIDLYRLERAEELDEIGWEDALDGALCVVEWAERLPAPPRDRLEIALAFADAGEGRIARLRAAGRPAGRLASDF